MKPSKGSDQSYDLNCSPNEAKEGGLGPPTCHYTSPHAIFVGVDFRTQSVTGSTTLVGPVLLSTKVVVIIPMKISFSV
jgi:hypothetical protein